jgi:GntR family transcriptional regulator/MocR family aminotransferase
MFGLNIDKNLGISITSQLIAQMREAILYGKIEANSKMPPTRSLAGELGVSRNTVIQVYEQLIAEGYLTGVTGSGTYAADLGAHPWVKKQCAKLVPENTRSGQNEKKIEFYAGNPDVSAFPRTMWAKALKEACLYADNGAFGYGELKGNADLRKALAGYLYRAKGIYCGSERIFIVPGTSAGIELISELLYSEGCSAAIEDPCLKFVSSALSKSGYKLIPIESDSQGMRTEMLPSDSNVKIIFAAPSHQYPLGGVLPIARRLDLLDYAQKNGAYIIEDDYDSEFRYLGEPIQPLWRLNDESVIYLGSFSNVFFPSLRMAYMILPQNLTERMEETIGMPNVCVGTLEQIALARVIESRQFDRHVYRMKRLYDRKRKFLLSCLKGNFGPDIKISGELAGFYMMVTLERDITDRDRKAFTDNGVEVDYAEDYAMIKGRYKKEIVLGYGNLSEAKIEEGVERLKKALNNTKIV